MAINFLNTVAVDDSVLFVDTINDRVGVGTSTPGSVLDVQGSQGQLFSVTDDLSGDIFAISDISGVPIMTVNSSGVSYFDGNVGIGTNNPTEELTVVGLGRVARIKATNDSVALVTENSSGSTARIGFKGTTSTSDYHVSVGANGTSYTVFTNNSERMRISESGNVGIGTTNPISDLDVTGTTGITVNSSGSNFIQFNHSGYPLPIATMKLSGWSDLEIEARFGETLIDTRRVGIRTSDPKGRLQINEWEWWGDEYDIPNPNGNQTAFKTVSIFADPTWGGLYLGMKDSYYANRGWAFNPLEAGGTSNLHLEIEEYGDITSIGHQTRAFFEAGTGNVGIGRFSDSSSFRPKARLHVAGEGEQDAKIYLTTSSGGTNGGYILSDDLVYIGGVNYTSENPVISFPKQGTSLNLTPGGSTKMTIDTNGNVGINTTLPAFKLDVDGTFGVSGIPLNTDSTFALVADEILGSQLIPNGNFATNSDWNLGQGQWTITGGAAVASNAGNILHTAAAVASSNGIVHKVTFTLSDVTGGYVKVGLSNLETTQYNTNGTYTVYLESSGNNYLYFHPYGFTGKVSNVSTYEVTNNQIQKRELGTGAFGPTPVGAYLPLDGGTMTGTNGVLMPDNFKLKFGDATTPDLEIYHDGSSSRIKDAGVGNLTINATDFVVNNSADTKNMIIASDGGSVNLYYNASQKFRTISAGVEVTGNINVDSALISNQENTDIDTGAEVVAQVVIATYTAAFFDFVVKKGTNVRSGTVYACHDGTNVEFTETSTQDLGDTSDVVLSVDISGANMRLLATVASDDWSVKSLIRAI